MTNKEKKRVITVEEYTLGEPVSILVLELDGTQIRRFPVWEYESIRALTQAIWKYLEENNMVEIIPKQAIE